MTTPHPHPTLLVMGVAGSGKSSLATALARATGARFLEGDAFHSDENVARMARGIPLTDADRSGWLARLAARLAEGRARGELMVLACSALKRRYRDLLREGDPGLLVVHLAGSRELIADRLARRTSHFMPPSLLDSQLRDLEPPQPDERAIVCDITETRDSLCEQVLSRLADLAPDRPSTAARGEPS